MFKVLEQVILHSDDQAVIERTNAIINRIQIRDDYNVVAKSLAKRLEPIFHSFDLNRGELLETLFQNIHYEEKYIISPVDIKNEFGIDEKEHFTITNVVSERKKLRLMIALFWIVIYGLLLIWKQNVLYESLMSVLWIFYTIIFTANFCESFKFNRSGKITDYNRCTELFLTIFAFPTRYFYPNHQKIKIEQSNNYQLVSDNV